MRGVRQRLRPVMRREKIITTAAASRVLWPPPLLPLLLLLLLGGAATEETAARSGRHLVQQGRGNSNNQLVIDSDNVDNVVELLSEVEDGTVVVFDVDRVGLREILDVTAEDVTLRGRDNRTVISCEEDEAHVRLRGSGAVFENFVVRNCVSHAINVFVEENLFSQEVDCPRPMNATIRNVDFTGNKEAEQFTTLFTGGGAITTWGATVSIERCSFERNEAGSGGAIWAVDSNVTVQECTFRSNIAQFSGGAIYLKSECPSELPMNVEIIQSNFSDNHDLEGGSAGDLAFEVGAPVESSQFISFLRPQSSGGAILADNAKDVLVLSCNFDGNTAVPAGGALYFSNVEASNVTDCSFTSNVAKESEQSSSAPSVHQGGAILLESTISVRGTFTDNKFINNTAGYGGALHLVTTVLAGITMSGNVFEENVALLGGGAVIFRNTMTINWLASNATRNRATAGGALMFVNGAGMIATQPPVGSSNSFFVKNEALDGGAMFILGGGQIQTQALQFINNMAKDKGGAVAAVDSLASGTILMQDALFEGNFAARGGGVFIDSIANFELRGSSQGTSFGRVIFRDNRALAGGALFSRPQNQVTNTLRFLNIIFEGNMALTDAAEVGFEDVQVPVASGSSGRSLLVESSDTRTSEQLLDPTAEDPCTAGGGGAICLVLNRVPERGEVIVDIWQANFTNNYCLVGGGLYVATQKGDKWEAPGDTCSGNEGGPLTSTPCRQLGIADAVFKNNTATAAGGAIFASDPDMFWMDPEVMEFFREYTPLSNLSEGCQLQKISKCEQQTNSTCELPTENNCIEEFSGFGRNVASTAKKLVLVSPVSDTEGEPIIQNHISGQNLPQIHLIVKDTFGQDITTGISDSELKVVASSNQVSGQLSSDAINGAIVFEGLRASAPPGDYILTFSADNLPEIKAEINVRGCRPGEENVGNNLCRNCSSGLFSFKPDVACRECDDKAMCGGGALLVPDDGYWHSTPFSVQFHECLIEEACEYDSKKYGRRNDTLAAFYTDLTAEDVTNEPRSNEEYRQCSEGYMGTLCGTCEPGYGHFPGGECVECNHSKGTTAIFILLVALWTLFLLAAAIKSALSSIRDAKEMATAEAQNTAKRLKVAGLAQAVQGPLPIPQSQSQMVEYLTVGKVEINEKVSAYDPLPASSSEVPARLIPAQDTVGKQTVHVLDSEPHVEIVATPGGRPIDHIIAAEKISETLKIATNFLQVTAVAVAINVDWTSSVKKLLGTWDVIAGFSNGASLIALDCVMSDDSSVPKSIRASVFRVFFPLMLFIVVFAWFVLVWCVLVAHPRGDRTTAREYLKNRTIITVLAVIFFAYQNVTEELMRTVNCVELDEKEDDPYAEFAIATDSYWGEDPALKCFEGSHAKLAGILGIPGLGIFSAGIPLYLLVFLMWNKSRAFKEKEFINSYGFVYQNYNETHIYWEVIILLRKGLIGAVVVFGYDAGANLQGIMALGVLIAALILHLVALPFRYKMLNILEGTSIVVSIFTFYSGIVFNDDNTTEVAKILLSVLLFLFNIILILVFVYKIYNYIDKYVTKKLSHLAGDTEIPKSFFGRCMALAHIVTTKVFVPKIRGLVTRSQHAKSISSNPSATAGVELTAGQGTPGQGQV